MPNLNVASTRNNLLSKKHMTTTTSPADRFDKTPDLKQQQRFSSNKKLNRLSNSHAGVQSTLSNQKRLKSKTIEIQEDQNEEDDKQQE